MRWRLRAQLLVPLSLLLVAVIGISTWTAISSANYARQQLATRMRHVAQTLSEAPQFPLTAQVLKQMKRLSGAEFVLHTSQGQTLSTFESGSIPNLDIQEAVSHWQDLHLHAKALVDDKSYLYSGARLRPPRENAVLFILYPESAWKTIQWKAIQPSLILGGFLGLAAFVLMVTVLQRLTRRVQGLERQTRRIADGDFSPMPLPSPDDEIRDLSRSINEMTEKLRQLQETVQCTERLRLLGQISGGLAHQLRNGITARLSLQLCLHDPDNPDPMAVDVALRQLTLLEAQLKRFFDLGQPRQQNLETCSISQLIAECFTLLSARCLHAGIQLCFEPPENDLTLEGDRGQLQELLLNVISNAVEAAGVEGWVKVTVTEHTANRLLIEVADSGSGPPESIIEKLFEPLITGKSEGVGLGLAVARQIAEMHGGNVTFSGKQEATCFSIELSRSVASETHVE